MDAAHKQALISDLQDKIDKLAGGAVKHRAALPFGVPDIDQRLPGGGLAYGALHEIAGGGADAVSGAVSALFAAAVAARSPGKILWCMTRTDLFAPGLTQVGLKPDRVYFCEAGDETALQDTAEEALRHGGLSVVVAELARLPMVVSRRLQLAAEKTGTMGLVIRRWRRPSEATDYGQPTASVTRWRVSALPSEPLPVPGVGRARWLVELMRVRASESFDIEVNAPDQRGRMSPVHIESHYGMQERRY